MITYQGPFRSNRKNKKFTVLVSSHGVTKKVDFGDTRYEDFTQHHNEERRRKYLARSSKIRDKEGNLTKDDPFSPNFWAMRLLWAYRD